MSQFLRDALLEHLFHLMAEHLDHGLDYDEALMLGVEEIRRQIRGSRGDLAVMLVEMTVRDVRDARDRGTRLH